MTANLVEVSNHTAYFLIVGTNYHPEEQRKLRAAVKDAVEVARIFEDFGYSSNNIILLQDQQVIRKGIFDEIEKLQEKRATLLFVYWAGHAIQDENNRVWLITQDTDNTNFLHNRAVSINELAQVITDCNQFSHHVLVLDTCHSGQANITFPPNIGSKPLAVLAACEENKETWEDAEHGWLTNILLEQLNNARDRGKFNLDIAEVLRETAQGLERKKGQKPVLTTIVRGAERMSISILPKKEKRAISTDPLEEALYYATQAFRNYLNRIVVEGVELIYFLGFDMWDGCLVYDGLVPGSIEQQLLNFIRNQFLQRDQLRSKYEEIVVNIEQRESADNQNAPKLGIAGDCLYEAQKSLKDIFNEVITNNDQIENPNAGASPIKNPTLKGIRYIGELNIYESEYRHYDQLLGLRSCLYIPVVENILKADFWLGTEQEIKENIESEINARDYGRVPLGGVLIAANRKAYGLSPKDSSAFQEYSKIPEELKKHFNNLKTSEIFAEEEYEKLINDEEIKDYFKKWDNEITKKIQEQLKGNIEVGRGEKKEPYEPLRFSELSSFMHCIGAVYKQRADGKLSLRQGLHPSFIKGAARSIKAEIEHVSQEVQDKANLLIEKISKEIEKVRLQSNTLEFVDLVENGSREVNYFLARLNLNEEINEENAKLLIANYLTATVWRDLQLELRLIEAKETQDNLIPENIANINTKLNNSLPSSLGTNLGINGSENLSWSEWVNNPPQQERQNTVLNHIIKLIDNLIDDLRQTIQDPFNIVYELLQQLAPIKPYIVSLTELEGGFGSAVQEKLFYELSHSILIWLLGLWVLGTPIESHENKTLRKKVIENIEEYFNNPPAGHQPICNTKDKYIIPWPKGEENAIKYLNIYWGLIATMHDIAIPVQQFKQLCYKFFEKYFCGENIFLNTEINKNFLRIDILDHPRFPIYKIAITSLYATPQRDWLEGVFYHALGKLSAHSTLGALLLVYELEPFCGYRSDEEKSLWRHIQSHLEDLSRRNNEQRELGLFLPAYLAHAVAFSDFPRLRKLWDTVSAGWNSNGGREYYNKTDDKFKVTFQKYPLSFLLGLFETLLEQINESELLDGIVFNKDSERNNRSDLLSELLHEYSHLLDSEKAHHYNSSTISYGSFYVEDVKAIEEDAQTIKLVLTVNLWDRNIKQENKKIWLKELKDLYRDYGEYRRNKERRENSNWILCSRKNYIGLEKVILDYNVSSKWKLKKEKKYFTITDNDNSKTEVVLSPYIYSCLRLLVGLKEFYNCYFSEEDMNRNKLNIQIKFNNIIIDGDPDTVRNRNPEYLICSKEEPKWFHEQNNG